VPSGLNRRRLLALADAKVEPGKEVGMQLHAPHGRLSGEQSALLSALVEPDVRELVSEHAIELPALVERSTHRHADDAVVRAGGPGGRSRDVVKLLGRVEHHRNGRAWISAQQLTDAPVGAVERRERLRGERLFGGSLKRHGEVGANRLAHAIVKRRLAPPPCERGLRAAIVGCRANPDADPWPAELMNEAALAIRDALRAAR
jgi:hypothetical protein